MHFYASTDRIITRSDHDIGQTNALLGDTTGTVALHSVFPTTIPAGTYFLGWIVTDDNRVDDCDERSNADFLESPVFIVTAPTSPSGPTISGYVRGTSGLGVGDVTISLDGGESTKTGDSGHYAMNVPEGWSGRTTPTKAGATFTPPSRHYTYVTTDQGGQDYVLQSYGAIIYVDGNARGVDDGSSWRDAFPLLQDGLTAAQAGSEIRVAQGVYVPDRGEGITRGDRDATFALRSGVVVRGGYAGASASNPDARDVSRYATILTGDLSGNDLEVPVPADLTREISRLDNSRHVVTAVDLKTAATLDGVRVAGGYADGWYDPDAPSPDSQGAGLYVSTSDFNLQRCTFEGNWAAAGGGAIHATRGNLRLGDCAFHVNAAGARGGAIEIDGGSVAATRCTLCANAAGNPGGGAIWSSNGELTLVSCTLNGNTAAYGGGAIGNARGSTLLAANCCLHANHATVLAGAIDHSSGSTATLINCTIADNRQDQYAGAVACGPADEKSTNELQINNCILWNVDGEIWNRGGSSISVEYTDIAGGWSGPGNFSINPLFTDPDGEDNVAGTADDDLRLHWASLCIDAGNAALLPEDIMDLDADGDLGEPLPLDRDGGTRVAGPTVDMGAYEEQTQ